MSINDPIHLRYDSERKRFYLQQGRESFYNERNQRWEFTHPRLAYHWVREHTDKQLKFAGLRADIDIEPGVQCYFTDIEKWYRDEEAGYVIRMMSLLITGERPYDGQQFVVVDNARDDVIFLGVYREGTEEDSIYIDKYAMPEVKPHRKRKPKDRREPSYTRKPKTVSATQGELDLE